jgi:cellulose synthase/poly-beta-1,6-N-acetylglucosamine synthase-like glycosyltransferase
MKISILIPCHNEAKSVKTCVASALVQTRPADEIIVVNDGSTDKTPEILKQFGSRIKVVNVYPGTKNKSRAQEYGLKFVTGDILITTDGDTKIDRNFVKRIEEDFKDPGVAAVGGYVSSLKHNWITAYRAFEYIIGQDVHKLAQSKLNFMFVIPGAAAAFRTDVFKKYLTFDHDTVTEDLDFTYKLHKNKLKIVFDRKAIVYTQDPPNLKSYINQIRRWYGGGFQNLMKHLDSEFVEDPRRTLELSLIYVDGIAFASMIFILPLINIVLTLKYFALFFAVLVLQSIYAAIREKRLDVLTAPFSYILLMFVNAAIFMEQLVNETILNKKNLFWHSAERISI